MAKLRSVNTAFWNDPFIEGLNPSEKLLFLYLITNPLCNLAGIYEITIKRICYDTGLNKEIVLKALKGFERLGKVYYIDNFMVIVNFLKNQKLNGNMRKNVVSILDELPKSLIDNIFSNGSEGFESLSNGLVMVRKDEDEDKSEEEGESERFNFKKSLIDLGIEEQVVSDWLQVRAKKKGSNTLTAFNDIKREITKCSLSPNECIELAVVKNWVGFKSDWVKKEEIPIKRNIPEHLKKNFLQ